MMKTDKRDALGLANTLYNQLALGIQVADKKELVRKAFPPSTTAAQLKGLIRHRYELVREAVIPLLVVDKSNFSPNGLTAW